MALVIFCQFLDSFGMDLCWSIRVIQIPAPFVPICEIWIQTKVCPSTWTVDATFPHPKTLPASYCVTNMFLSRNWGATDIFGEKFNCVFNCFWTDFDHWQKIMALVIFCQFLDSFGMDLCWSIRVVQIPAPFVPICEIWIQTKVCPSTWSRWSHWKLFLLKTVKLFATCFQTQSPLPFSTNIDSGRYFPAEKFFGRDTHDTGCRDWCYSGTYFRCINCK